LRDEPANIDATISSRYSPDSLLRSKLDLAFMRPEAEATELSFKPVIEEPPVVILPSDHRLAVRDAIRLDDIVARGS